MKPEFTSIIATVTGDRGTLVLNRPEKLNPLGTDTLEEIAAAVRWFDTQPDLKVVVVSGSGRAFSAGADLVDFVGLADRPDPRHAADSGRRMADAMEAMRAVTVARIHGHCVGGGLVLAAACDLRVAADDAVFSIPEVDLGIPLAWGGVPRLVREIGPALTKELVMTCRPFGAEEALNAGFLNRVVAAADIDATVARLVDELAAKPKFALLATKRHVNAVTSTAFAPQRSWSDADGLLTASHDADSLAARDAYLERLRQRAAKKENP